MTFPRLIAAIALTSLAGCMDTTGAGSSAPPPAAVADNIAPPPGRTDAERQVRKDFYRGPRGDF